jgi:hypothetical protein
MTTAIGVITVLGPKSIIIEVKSGGILDTLTASPDIPGFAELGGARRGDPVTVVVEEFQGSAPSCSMHLQLVELEGIPIDRRGTIDLAMGHARLAVATPQLLSTEHLSDQTLAAYLVIDADGSEDEAREAATRVLVGLSDLPARPHERQQSVEHRPYDFHP